MRPLIIALTCLLAVGCGDSSSGNSDKDQGSATVDSGGGAADAGGSNDGGGGVADLGSADLGAFVDSAGGDGGTTDLSVTDAYTGDGSAPPPPARCQPGAAPGIALQEIAVEQPDYLALKNLGKSAVDLRGYKLVMLGISPTATFTINKSRVLKPQQIAYVFEYSKGSQVGDINTGSNIPFYDGPPTATSPNAVALYSPGGHLLDYVAIGGSAGLPKGATFVAIPWPSSFDGAKQSFQRARHTGRCPAFTASDWKVAPLTRP